MGWYDAPIRADDIIEGSPYARSWDLHASRAGGVSMNYWDCTAGRFSWHYGTDEMITVLEGEVHITDEHGATFTLRGGDTAHFLAGTSVLWHVPEYVRKLAFHRNPQTVPDRVLSRVVRMLGPAKSARRAEDPSGDRPRMDPRVGPSLPDAGFPQA
jgi:uncharacterized cupin superfamily protein